MFDVLAKYAKGQLPKKEFLSLLCQDTLLMNALEAEKQLGTHAGDDNLLLYLLNTCDDPHASYEQKTIPLVTQFLGKNHVTHFHLHKREAYVWFAPECSYETYCELLTDRINGAPLFETLAGLQNQGIDWNSAFHAFYGHQPPQW